MVSWGKTDLLRLRAQARPSTSRLRVRKDGAEEGRPTACLAGTEGFAGVSRTQEGRDAGPGMPVGTGFLSKERKCLGISGSDYTAVNILKPTELYT